jgi:ribosomal-protein-alanine N-acetyltransferase
MKVAESFKTGRIRARRLTPGDLDDLATMYQTPLVMQTLGGVLSREQTIITLDDRLSHWENFGYGFYAFEDKRAESFMGRGGLRQTIIDGVKEIEVAYAFMPDYWGQGLATEVVKELVSIAIDDIGLTSVIAFTLPENKASARVLEKAGFVFEKETIRAELPHNMYRYSSKR